MGASQVRGLPDLIASQVRDSLDSFTKTLNLFWEAMFRLIWREPVRDLRLLELAILELFYLWTKSVNGSDTWPGSICLPLLRWLPVWLLLLLMMVAMAVIDWGLDWLYSFVNMFRQLINLSCRDRCAKENILNKGSKRLTDSIRWTLI